MPGLTVFCVCVGTKYHPGYVYALRDAVSENLTIPHEFRCITTLKLPGVETVLPFLPYQSFWSKFNLFCPTISKGPSLYFDLDVVITGSLDYLVDYTKHRLSAPANWAQSGHGGIQSSVMAWNGEWREPVERIRKEWPGECTPDGYRIFRGKKFWGDQEYLHDMLGDRWERIPGIRSFKYHCKNGVPKDTSVVVFHGKPDYPEVDNEWIRRHTGRWYFMDRNEMAAIPSIQDL